MVQIPNNGRTLRRGDPLRDAIIAKQRDYKANGVPFPCRIVDDYFSVPFVWLGRVPYRADTLERLALTQEARKRPVPLPDHFMLDGVQRLPTENASQYAKYLAYRDLGPERSLNKVAKMMGRKAYGRGAANSGYYSALASRFRWEERVTAWDGALAVEAKRAMQAVQQDQMHEHIERREVYLESEYQTVVKALGRIAEMLDLPIVKKSVVDDKTGQTIIWEPAKWTYASLSQLMGEVAKIAHLHFGMATSNAAQKIDATLQSSNQKPQAFDMNDPDAEMHRYASQRAEDEFFRAIDDWKVERREPDRIGAQIEG